MNGEVNQADAGAARTSEALEADRLENLLAWQFVYDQRLDKLSIIILVGGLFYLYYSLISPLLAHKRLANFEIAREDIKVIEAQFEQLRDRYSMLVLPSMIPPIDVPNEIRIFDQHVLAELTNAVQVSGTSPGKAFTLSPEEAVDLSRLSEAMNTLYTLYRDHYTSHPPLPEFKSDLPPESIRLHIANFRRAMGTLLSQQAQGSEGEEIALERDRKAASELYALLVGRHSHKSIDEDPVNDLSALLELEAVITYLKDFEGAPENWTLCDKFRYISGAQMKTNNAAGLDAIRLGDTLTQSFRPYRILAEYTPAQKSLQFSPSQGLRSYVDIQELLGAPFELRTISDLYKLEKLSESLIDDSLAEVKSPALQVPVLDASIDRIIVLGAFPFFFVFLLHITRIYAERRDVIAEAMFSRRFNIPLRFDYFKYAPLPFFYLPQRRVGKNIWLQRSGSVIAGLFRYGLLLLPILVLVTLVTSSFVLDESVSSLGRATFLLSGTVSIALMVSELIMIRAVLEITMERERRLHNVSP